MANSWLIVQRVIIWYTVFNIFKFNFPYGESLVSACSLLSILTNIPQNIKDIHKSERFHKSLSKFSNHYLTLFDEIMETYTPYFSKLLNLFALSVYIPGWKI